MIKKIDCSDCLETMNIYVFGNEYLAEDSLARKVSEYLASDKITIVHCRSPEEILEAEENPVIILDVVKGITKPIVIEDPAELKTRSIISLHDFDLGFFLNLLTTLREDVKIRIIGIPQTGEPKELAVLVEEIIEKHV